MDLFQFQHGWLLQVYFHMICIQLHTIRFVSYCVINAFLKNEIRLERQILLVILEASWLVSAIFYSSIFGLCKLRGKCT